MQLSKRLLHYNTKRTEKSNFIIIGNNDNNNNNNNNNNSYTALQLNSWRDLQEQGYVLLCGTMIG